MVNDPDRTYIFARLWLDFPLNTIVPYTTNLADADLARLLDACGARTLRRAFVTELPAAASDDGIGDRVVERRRWATQVPPLDSDTEAALGAAFMDAVGHQYLAEAMFDRDPPRYPQWIVMHSTSTLELAHDVMECMHRSPPFDSDVEMFAVQKNTLSTVEWARVERDLQEFDVRAIALDMKSLLTPGRSPIVRFREDLIKWANAIEAGLDNTSSQGALKPAPPTNLPESVGTPHTSNAIAEVSSGQRGGPRSRIAATTHLESPEKKTAALLTIEFVDSKGTQLAVTQIRGAVRARLAQYVIDNPDTDHDWDGLLSLGLAREWWRGTSAKTLERTGRLIMEQLDPAMKGYWAQDGRSVRWRSP